MWNATAPGRSADLVEQYYVAQVLPVGAKALGHVFSAKRTYSLSLPRSGSTIDT